MKRNYLVSLFLMMMFCPINIYAQEFNRYFSDATLRLDYIFAGNTEHQSIYLNRLNKLPRWYGKRKNLTEVPMEGYGQIIVREHSSQQIIYRNSFSTLFQEWLSYDEAKSQHKSFENVLLIPMPNDTVDVTVELYNNRREVMTQMEHQVIPSDILIRNIGNKPTPYDTLVKAPDPDHAINIAFVAEGYTNEEMSIFINDCNTAIDAIFEHEPFKSAKSGFNIVAVKSSSIDSGTSEPGNGIWRNTVLGSHFNTFYSDRYLTTLNLFALHDVLAGTPYEHIIVLVNTEKYGGGGILNSYNLSMTHHPKFRPVVVHEFGHSFAGLADEYAYETEEISMYPHDIEPWEQNITTLVDFSSKWENMMGHNGVGLNEGSGYSPKGLYRPCKDCRMRTNETPDFCPICQHILKKVIDFYTK